MLLVMMAMMMTLCTLMTTTHPRFALPLDRPLRHLCQDLAPNSSVSCRHWKTCFPWFLVPFWLICPLQRLFSAVQTPFCCLIPRFVLPSFAVLWNIVMNNVLINDQWSMTQWVKDVTACIILCSRARKENSVAHSWWAIHEWSCCYIPLLWTTCCLDWLPIYSPQQQQPIAQLQSGLS